MTNEVELILDAINSLREETRAQNRVLVDLVIRVTQVEGWQTRWDVRYVRVLGALWTGILACVTLILERVAHYLGWT